MSPIRSASWAIAAAMLALGACSSEDPKPDESEPKATPSAPSPTDVERLSLADVEDLRVDVSSPDAMVTGFGSLWVKRDDGSVARVAPNGKVRATIDAELYQPPVCQGLGVSDAAAWACASNGKIIRIDPGTNEVAATVEVPNLNEQVRLASSGGHVWLLTDDGNRLTGISEETNRLGEPIELDSFCTDVSDRADGSILWVTCASEGIVLRVDLAAGKVTGKVTELPLATNVSVGEYVWVGFEGGLAQIDPQSLEVTMVHDVAPAPGGSIRASDEAVWLREDAEDFLTRLDPRSGAVLQVVTADDLPSGGDVIEFDGAVWASAYDDAAVVRLTPPG